MLVKLSPEFPHDALCHESMLSTLVKNIVTDSRELKLEEELKEKSIEPLSSEGHKGGDWVIVDLSDVVIHVLTEEARELYDLEKLWRFDMKPESKIDQSV